MKKLFAVLVVSLAIPTMGFAKGEGRYQGIIDDYPNSSAIWIVDTKTGLVKLCFESHPVGFQLRTKCTAWNSEIKYYADENLNKIED